MSFANNDQYSNRHMIKILINKIEVKICSVFWEMFYSLLQKIVRGSNASLLLGEAECGQSSKSGIFCDHEDTSWTVMASVVYTAEWKYGK